MSSLDLFVQHVKASVVGLGESEREALASLWGGAAAEPGSALTGASTPGSLLRAARRLPNVEVFEELLGRFEQDANVQDDWMDVAGGRQLQDVKASYMQALRRSAALEAELDEEDRARVRTLNRLVSKLSNALLAHPDNAHGECDIYGHFKATGLARSGKFDNTFEGEDLDSGETVAIKVLRPELGGNLPLVHAFVAGTAALREVRHPGIAGVLEPATRPQSYRDKVFVVTEWRGAKTLADAISGGGLAPLRRLELATELCQALVYMHARGRVHGNLSPDNVLVADSGRVHLTGFLAPPSDLPPGAWPQIVMALGSPYYVAPELTSGALPTAASDLFALGRVLFRLLTGKEENLYDVMVPQLYAQALEQHLGGFPELIAALQATTALDPAGRPAGVREVLAELERQSGRLARWGIDELDAALAAGSWGEVLAVIEAVSDVSDEATRLLLLQEAAGLHEYVLGDAQASLATWARIYRVGAAGRALAMDYLDRLRRDLGDAYSAQAVADAFASAVDEGLVDDAAEALELNLRAARLYRGEVGNPTAAIRYFLGALELEAGNDEAFTALDELYQQQQDWAGLIALLNRRIEVVPAIRDKIALLFRIARVEEDNRWSASASAEAYARALALNPGHAGAFQNLNRLLRELGRWDALAELLADRIGRTEEARQATALRFELAEVHRLHRGDPAAAIALYRTILSTSPDHAETIASLEALLAESIEPLEAAALLEPIYRRTEAWGPLAVAVETLLMGVDPSDERWVEMLREVAELREHRVGDRDAAFDAFASLHAGRPRAAWVWEELERLAPLGAAPRWSELVGLYGATIEGEPGSELAADLWRRVGEVHRMHLNDAAAAIGAFRSVLALRADDADALDQLEDLLANTGAFVELSEVLQTKARLAQGRGEVAAARRLLHRAADLHEGPIGEPPRAVELLHAALELDSAQADDHAQAELERLAGDAALLPQVAAILDPRYEALGAWDRLVGLVLSQIAHDPAFAGAAERGAAYERLAQVAEHRMQDASAAFDHMRSAVLAEPSREDRRAELARLTDATGRYADAAAFYDQLLDDAGAELGEALQIVLLEVVGRWYWGQLLRLDEAIARFQRLLALEPTHGGALDALDAIFSELGRAAELADVLGRKASLASEVEDEIDLRFRIAHLAERNLSDPELAIAALRRVVELDGSSYAALDALALIFERLERWPELAHTLQLRVSIEPEAQRRVELHARIGQLALDHIRDPSFALLAFQRAIAEGPAQPLPILMAILHIVITQDDVPAFFQWLTPTLEHLTDRATIVQLHLRAARLATRAEAPAGASPIHHYEAVLRVEPYHVEAIANLEIAYAEGGAWDHLEDIYRRQFVRLHIKSAQLALSGLHAPTRALEHLMQARALDPHRVEILDRLIEVYEALGDHDSMQALMEQRLDLMDDQPAEKARLLARRAAAFAEEGQPEQALDAWTRSLLLSPLNAAGLAAFTRLALELDRFVEVSPQVIGALRADGINPASSALMASLELTLRAVTALSESQPTAAVEHLRALAGAEHVDPDLTLDLLQIAFVHFDALDALIATLRDASELLGPEAPRWRDALLTKSAELAEQRGDREQALAIYTQLFRKDPALARARQHMLRLAGEQGRVGEALEAIATRLDAGLSDAGLTAELALLLATHFDREDASEDDARQAATHYQRALAARPGDAAALGALARLYDRLGDTEALVAILRRTIATQQRPADQAALRLRLANLALDAQNDPRAAIGLANEVLRANLPADNPSREQARHLLEAILEHPDTDAIDAADARDALRHEFSTLGAHDRVLELLEAQLADLGDDASASPEAVALLRDLADTADRLPDARRAFVFRLRWLRIEPDNDALRTRLEAAAVEDDDLLASLVDAYLHALNQGELPERLRLRLALYAAAALRDRLQQPDDAVDAFELALQIDPGHPEALDALADIYYATARFEPLVDLLLRRARAADQLSAEARRELFLRAADLAEHQLQQPERAAAAYQSLLEDFGPDADILARLEAIHATSGNLRGQLDVLRFQIDLARGEDPDAAPGLLLRAARLAHHQLALGDDAIALYEELRDADPANGEALEALASLYRAAGRWPELLVTNEQRALLTEDPALRFALLDEAAHVAAEHLDDPDTAIQCLRDAQLLRPGEPDTHARLAALLEAQGRWSDVLDLRLRDLDRLQGEGDAEALIQASLAIAQLALDPARLDDVELGKTHLRAVLDLNPEHPGAIRQLLLLDERTGDWADAVRVLDRMLRTTPDAAAQVDLLLRQADIYRERLGDESAATALYRHAYELDAAGRSPARDRLLAILSTRGAWGEIVDIVETDIQRCTSVEQQVGLELQLVQILRDNHAAPQRLIEVLERAWHRGPEPSIALDIITQLIDAWSTAGALGQAAEWVERGFEIAERAGAKDKLAGLWYYKGLVAHASGNIHAAIIAHQETWKLDARRLDNILVLSRLLYETEQWNEALKALQVALLKQNELSDAERLEMYYLMGMIRVKMDDPRRAKDMFRRALAVDKTHAPSQAMLDSL